MSQKSSSDDRFSTPVGRGGSFRDDVQGLAWDSILESQRLSEKRRRSSVESDTGSASKVNANNQADGEHSGWVGPPLLLRYLVSRGSQPLVPCMTRVSTGLNVHGAAVFAAP